MTHGGGNIMSWRGMIPALADSVYVAPGAHVIGDVGIGADSSIWFNTVVRGDVHDIRIGARTNIQDGSVVHVTHERFGTHIGDDVLVGHRVTLHGCRIGNRAFVGMNSVVMDGCEIEDGGMLAAGALLPPGKRVGAGELWKGWPATYARPLSEAETAWLTEGPAHYARLAARYLAEARGAA